MTENEFVQNMLWLAEATGYAAAAGKLNEICNDMMSSLSHEGLHRLNQEAKSYLEKAQEIQKNHLSE